MDEIGTAAESKPLVLVADGDEYVRLLLALRLRRCGFAVVEAGDVSAALQAVAAHDPAFVVLDVNMADLDEAAARCILTAADGGRRVAFLSTDAALADGAGDLLAAAVDETELLARLRRTSR